MSLENPVSLITSVNSFSVFVCVGAVMSWPLVQAVTPPPSPKHSWHRLVRHSTLNSNELRKRIDGGVWKGVSALSARFGVFFFSTSWLAPVDSRSRLAPRSVQLCPQVKNISVEKWKKWPNWFI